MGSLNVDPMADRTALGLHTSTQFGSSRTPLTFTANPLRRSVPAFPGSDTPSNTRYSGGLVGDCDCDCDCGGGGPYGNARS
mmetsp:Transcript_37184/g.54736  ORF Transcript_37184/g.54736 Transcript_37184/m.54736 type:complete len:81 (-) Transcript_37184:547-789(-)